LAPETAAEQCDVDRHILWFEAEFVRQLGARRAWPLRRRVWQMRDLVLYRDGLRGIGECLIGTALVAHDLARLARGLFELGFVSRAASLLSSRVAIFLVLPASKPRKASIFPAGRAAFSITRPSGSFSRSIFSPGRMPRCCYVLAECDLPPCRNSQYGHD
jgi:hypothetical protein